MNAHLGLIHALLPTTVDLRVTVPESHPSTRNLGSERMGSGTIVDPEGYILTVHYVILGAESITVTLADGEQLPGELAAQDFETGLALVKIPGRDLPFMRPAPPDALSLGQPTFIVASSGETGRRVSGGYITSLESYDGHWEYLLEETQHDGRILPVRKGTAPHPRAAARRQRPGRRAALPLAAAGHSWRLNDHTAAVISTRASTPSSAASSSTPMV